MLIGLDPLAYITAKTHGLTEEAEAILETCGLTEDQIKLPSLGEPLQVPPPLVPTFKANWPVKAAGHSSFEKALLGEVGIVDEETGANGYELEEEAEEAGLAAHEALEEEEEDVAGWDMGDEINVEEDHDFVNVESVEAGAVSSEADLWARNSPLAADHVAAGSFDTAMQLLNRQVGAVNFAPLKERFLEIYQASKTYLPATAGLPPLVNYVRRTVDETDSRKVLPIIPRDLETIANVDLQEGYAAMRANKLEDGVKIFKRILYTLLVNTVSSESEVEQAKKIIATAREYILAMSIELHRRTLPADKPEHLKRILELSAYFTIPKLEVAHRQLALMAAMKLAFANKNYASALSFANRMLANGGSAKLLDQVSRLVCFHIWEHHADPLTAGQEDQSSMRAQPPGQDRYRIRPVCGIRSLRGLLHSHLQRLPQRIRPIHGGQVSRTVQGIRLPDLGCDGNRGTSKRSATVCTWS
jgi:coatomer protein complex subunit alpha (xenin)